MTMTSPRHSHSNREHVPLAVLASFGISTVALLITAGILPMPIVFFAAAVGSYFIDARLVGNNPNRWFIRLGLILFIYLLNPEQARDMDWAIGTARLRNLFAQYYAAEVALQFYRFRPRTETEPGDSVRSRLIALVLSGMIFLSASNTFEERWIRFLTPLWLGSCVLALIGTRPRRNNRLASSSLRALALLSAFGIGMGGYLAIYAQRGNLNEWSARLVRFRPQYASSGMTQNPRLGETFDLRGSPVRVLRIEKFTGEAHWRGLAFDEYDNGRWGPSFVQRPYRQVTDALLNPPQISRRTDQQEMTVSRLTSSNPLLYAPLGMASLNIGDNQDDTQVSLEAGGPFRLRSEPPLIYLVTLTSEEQYQGLLANNPTTSYRARCLRLPSNFDERVAALARQVVSRAGARTPREKAEAIAAYLITTHQYSLQYRATTPDPIVGFLTSTPPAAAHCEYFATGATLMLRTVGVPTRYVTGYLAHESEGQGQVIVRQQDAHAWCEAYIDGVGWVTVDATPGNGRPDKNPQPIDRWRRFQEWFQDRWAQVGGFLGDFTNTQGRPIILGLLAFLVGGGIIGYLRSVRRQRKAGWQYQAGPEAVANMQKRFDAALSRQNLHLSSATSYRQFVDAQEPAWFTETARQWVQVYESARFGDADDAALKRLEELTKAIEGIARINRNRADSLTHQKKE